MESHHISHLPSMQNRTESSALNQELCFVTGHDIMWFHTCKHEELITVVQQKYWSKLLFVEIIKAVWEDYCHIHGCTLAMCTFKNPNWKVWPDCYLQFPFFFLIRRRGCYNIFHWKQGFSLHSCRLSFPISWTVTKPPLKIVCSLFLCFTEYCGVASKRAFLRILSLVIYRSSPRQNIRSLENFYLILFNAHYHKFLITDLGSIQKKIVNE